MKDNWLKPFKVAINRAVPWLYQPLQAIVYQRRYGAILSAVLAAHGRRVAAGPFSGMHYLTTAAGSSILPKLLGTYEAELHPVIDDIRRRRYTVIVDVGCAEGYYAVGLARLFRDVKVRAFDTDARARELCHQLAAMNQVAHQIDVGGACTCDMLSSLNGERALVISDCEGYEKELFNDAAVSSLRLADVLIEAHDFLSPGVTDTLVGRFDATHRVAYINATRRRKDSKPARFLPRRYRLRAMEEGRPANQRWLWLQSKAMLSAERVDRESADVV